MTPHTIGTLPEAALGATTQIGWAAPAGPLGCEGVNRGRHSFNDSQLDTILGQLKWLNDTRKLFTMFNLAESLHNWQGCGCVSVGSSTVNRSGPIDGSSAQMGMGLSPFFGGDFPVLRFWMRRGPVALWILPFLPESVPLKIVQQEEMLIPSWTFGSEPCQWQTSVDSLGHSTSGLWGVWARTGALTRKLRRCAKRRWISRGSLSIRRFFVLLSPDSFQGNLYTLEIILFSFFPGGKSANGSQLEAPFGAASIQTPISTSCCHGRIADMKIPLNASTEVSFTGEASGSWPSELQMFIKFRKYEGFRLHSLFYPPI